MLFWTVCAALVLFGRFGNSTKACCHIHAAQCCVVLRGNATHDAKRSPLSPEFSNIPYVTFRYQKNEPLFVCHQDLQIPGIYGRFLMQATLQDFCLQSQGPGQAQRLQVSLRYIWRPPCSPSSFTVPRPQATAHTRPFKTSSTIYMGQDVKYH